MKTSDLKPGDLLEVWSRTALWSDAGAPLRGGEDDAVHPGDIIVFIGKGRYMFVRILHPVLGIRQIHRHYVRPVHQ